MEAKQSGFSTIRVWLSETQQKLRFKHILTAVVDVEMSSRTGKFERFFFHFFENGYGKRRIHAAGSREATEYRAWEFNQVWRDIAEPWKAGLITTEEAKTAIDRGVNQNVSAGLCNP